MKIISSDALGMLTKALGLTGRGAQVTELTDGIVEQNLDVTPIIRRGRTLAGTEGLFMGTLRTVHAGADSATVSWDPYTMTPTTVRAPYPSPVPDTFDIWLLSAWLTQIAGTGTVSATLSMILPATMVGPTTSGSAVPTTSVLAFWDALVTEDVEFGLLAGSGMPQANIGMRLPRARPNGTEIEFATTSSAAATFECAVMMGLFPVGLGQDCLVG